VSAQCQNWTVLLIGGASGVGKTVAAKSVALRLALQASRVTLPRDTGALYFFTETPDVWSLPPERLRDALIAVGEVMAPAIEIVTLNHVDTVAPAVIEGDGILPSLLARQSLRERAAGGRLRAVFLVEPDERVMLANSLARARGIDAHTEAELGREARAKWLYGQWLAREASRHGLPVLEPRPWSTLPERILAAATGGPQPRGRSA
jgi:2-phosphoglycerate kinase